MTVAEETGAASLANPKQQAEGEATTTNKDKGVDLTSAKALFEAVESSSKEDLDVSAPEPSHRSVSRPGLTHARARNFPPFFSDRPTGAGDIEGPRG